MFGRASEGENVEKGCNATVFQVPDKHSALSIVVGWHGANPIQTLLDNASIERNDAKASTLPAPQSEKAA